jgi:hypothetical protein
MLGQDHEGIHQECTVSDPVAIPSHGLRAWKGVAILAAYLSTQVVASILLGGTVLIWMILFGVLDLEDRLQFDQVQTQIMPPILLLSTLLSFGVVLGLVLKLAPPALLDCSPQGVGWARGDQYSLGLAILSGGLLASLYLLLSITYPPSPHLPLSPLVDMATTPGLARWIWVILALGVAPLGEELLFRGILLGSLVHSVGSKLAAVGTTLLFVVLHPDALVYWPALLGIGALAITCILFRWRSQALGPAIAVHLAYNAVIVCSAWL